VHLRLQTETIPQTDYDDYDDYSDYDYLRAQALWTIEAAINKSSANDPLTLSKQKLLAAQALMATLDDNIQLPDRNGEMQRVRALVDCGATSIFMTPRLLKRLGISHQAAHITTLGMNGGVM